MKKYEGFRTHCGTCLVFVSGVHRPYILPSRTDLWTHSATGFEWGYLGSGPAQLALALLADATCDDALALKCYQHYKEEVVLMFPKAGWAIEELDVLRWVTEYLSNQVDYFVTYNLAPPTADGGKVCDE